MPSWSRKDPFCSTCRREKAADAPPFPDGRCPDCEEKKGDARIRRFCSKCGDERAPEMVFGRGSCCFTWSDLDHYDAHIRRKAIHGINFKTGKVGK